MTENITTTEVDLNNSLFLTQASQAAKVHVQTWIRATLREVVLQTLQRYCLMQEEDSSFHVQEDVIFKAQSACQMVANRWKQRLQTMGFHSLALCIDTVVEQGHETLYYRKVSSTVNDWMQNQVPTPMSNVSSVQPDKVTTIGRLRSLKKCTNESSDDPNNDVYLQKIIQQLNVWGRAGHTDWPHDWSFVEQAVKEIPQRLYYKQQRLSESSSSSSSSLDKSKNEENQREKRRMLRKRRRKQRRGNVQCRSATTPTPNDIPRPPYNGTERLELLDCFTEEDQTELNSYLHSDHDTNSTPSIVLLGALQDLGQYYFHQRKAASDLSTTSSSPTETKTFQQRRKWQRDRIRERLAGHKPVGHREMAGHRPSRSRVLHCYQDEHYFMDFDMSHCLVEWRTPTENHLLFFSNVEVVLKDEDV